MLYNQQLCLKLLMMVTNRLVRLWLVYLLNAVLKTVPVYVSYFLFECSLVKFKTIND